MERRRYSCRSDRRPPSIPHWRSPARIAAACVLASGAARLSAVTVTVLNDQALGEPPRMVEMTATDAFSTRLASSAPDPRREHLLRRARFLFHQKVQGILFGIH